MRFVAVTAVVGPGAAVGLLPRKSWGIHLALGLEVFSAANHAVTFLSPKSLPWLREALAAMAAEGAKPPLHDLTAGFHYLQGLGLTFALALLSTPSFRAQNSLKQLPRLSLCHDRTT